MKLGEKQILYVVKRVEFGVYLAEHHNDTEERVLLPANRCRRIRALEINWKFFCIRIPRIG